LRKSKIRLLYANTSNRKGSGVGATEPFLFPKCIVFSVLFDNWGRPVSTF